MDFELADTVPRDKTASFWTSLLAGAAAGTTVDVTLYPMDTIKTRLQSAQGQPFTPPSEVQVL